MLFNSLIFLVFFPTVYALYRMLPFRWQNALLLVASYAFYAKWDWRFLGLIWLSTAVDYVCALAIHASDDACRRRLYVTISTCSNLAILGTFKYFDFFSGSFHDLATALGFDASLVRLHLVLPVGISFYTFQSLAYTIDVYRRRIEPEPSLPTFALYVAFFPQLVAGPIERASHLLPQLKRPRSIGWEDIKVGVWQIAWGYFLKVFMGDNMALVVEPPFVVGADARGLETLFAVYGFMIQLFGDFAGYSYIAIGTARLMGIRLATNFLFPFFITRPSQFWANWHITLSNWLRDYVYISLGGNRVSWSRNRLNLFITMVLGGLWHGASYSYVVWGALHGSLLVLERIVRPRLPREIFSAIPQALRTGVKMFLMFNVTCFAQLVFRAETLPDCARMFRTIVFDFGGMGPSAQFAVVYFIFCSWLYLAVQVWQYRSRDVETIEAIPQWARIPVIVLMTYSVLVWGQFGAKEFVYFQF